MAKKIDFRLLLDRFNQISFDFNTLKKYMWVFHLFIIFLLAKSISDIVVSYLDQRVETPVTKKPFESPPPSAPTVSPPTLDQFSIIMRRNIFNPKAKEEDFLGQLREHRMGLDETGAIATSLPFEFLGTIILSDASRSVVAIKDTQKNRVESYQVGDTISETAKIYKINPLKVYFQNLTTGQLEYIELKEKMSDTPFTTGRSFERFGEPAGGVRETAPGRFTIDRGALESSLADPNKILTQAKAVPNIVGGKIQGFRIFSIHPGSIYEKLGIKNGDVVLRINGIDLDSPAKALEFYGTLSSASDVSLDIERGGQKVSYQYSVK